MSKKSGTPSFHEALKTVFNAFLGEEINTALPGIVDSYDHTKQQATVTPAIHKKFVDGEVLPYKPIQNIPVIFPRSANFSFTYPLNKGDSVLLIFSQRAMEVWLSKGEFTEPGDRRKFDITDAICIPGLYPFNQESQASSNKQVEIRYKDANIIIQDNGTISINNDNLTVEI